MIEKVAAGYENSVFYRLSVSPARVIILSLSSTFICPKYNSNSNNE